jgi:hypothetical protein
VQKAAFAFHDLVDAQDSWFEAALMRPRQPYGCGKLLFFEGSSHACGVGGSCPTSVLPEAD